MNPTSKAMTINRSKVLLDDLPTNINQSNQSEIN